MLHYRLGDYRAAAPYFRAATKAPSSARARAPALPALPEPSSKLPPTLTLEQPSPPFATILQQYNNQAPCNSASERDFGEFMRAASVEALRACEAELSKG